MKIDIFPTFYRLSDFLFSSVSGNLGFIRLIMTCAADTRWAAFFGIINYTISISAQWPYYLDGDELFQSSAERLKAKQEAFNKMIKKKLKRLQVQVLYPAPTSSDYEPILLFEPQVRRWHNAKKRKWQTGNKYLKINIWNEHMLE